MKSIYLVLDMQNDLVHADGASGKAPMQADIQAREVIQRTASAISRARAKGIPVAYVRVAFSDDHREANPSSQVFGPIAKNGILKMNAWGGQVHEALAPQAGDWDIVKHRVSPFYQTKLELLLKREGIERIYCSGVSTQAVVQATVRDAHDRDYDVVVLEDCCAGPNEQEHANSLASIARFCSVATSETAFE
ncbi:cysteine hydrolase family protein [Halopseudomonas phragmitis]|uniref:Chloramphenicol resistance protein n=1 Tax=Halopseudomonas phragmitis TaxID=1931241 RepID=A0A1V0B8K7_9GAMM|nr:isochorismatase family cysteine hydrolase [Halopseudomonas phragmitis]AQZ96237.1 chloramphenicol resistance protein [Halopseudomonas phragmitis]